MKRSTLLALVFLTVGCGGDGGSVHGDADGRMVHFIAAGLPHVPPGGTLMEGPVAVPQDATVSYVVMDRPMVPSVVDMMDVAVVDQTSGQRYDAQAGVTSASATTDPLPAGTYAFTVDCHDTAGECWFTDMVTALY